MKRIDKLIRNSDTLLDNYVQIAQQLSALNALLKTVLPVTVRNHCQIANYRDGCLIIQATNAAWATQLRYLIPDIQVKLQAIPQFKDVQTIRYFVAPATAITVANNPIQPQLSAQNAQLILDTAEHIPGRLGKALGKLALHAKKTKTAR